MPLTRREFLAATLAAGAATGLAGACGLFDEDRPERIAYGSARSQFGELWLPGDAPAGTAVLVHGGAWADREDLSLIEPMARDLRDRGWAVWNVEYRRIGESGAGWPGTFEDVGAAIDHVAVLAEEHPVDPARTVVVGHSAGGTLALWAAGREGRVRPRGHVALAAVTDLAACVEEDVLSRPCRALLGGRPDEVPGRYRQASPVERLPTGSRLGVVHGAADVVVPVRQSRGYAEAAEAAGDPITLDVLPDTGHFPLIAPDHPAYQDTVVPRLEALLQSPPT